MMSPRHRKATKASRDGPVLIALLILTVASFYGSIHSVFPATDQSWEFKTEGMKRWRAGYPPISRPSREDILLRGTVSADTKALFVQVFGRDCVTELSINGVDLAPMEGECAWCLHCHGRVIDAGGILRDADNEVLAKVENLQSRQTSFNIVFWNVHPQTQKLREAFFFLFASLLVGYIVVSSMRRKDARMRSALTLVILALVLFTFMERHAFAHERGRHTDERNWLAVTYFYHLLFVEGDISNEHWDTFASYEQPNAGKYLLGHALESSGAGAMDQGYWIGTDWINRVKDGLDNSHFMVGRKTMSFYSLMAVCMLLIVFTRYLDDPLAGAVAAYMLLANDIADLVFDSSIMDAICTFTAYLSLVALLWTLSILSKGPKGPHVIAASAASGAAVAIATSSKLLNVYAGAAVLAAYSLLWAIKEKQGDKRGARMAALAVTVLLLSSYACLVLLNPFTQYDIIGNTYVLFKSRYDTMGVYSLQYKDALYQNPVEKAMHIYRNGVLAGQPMSAFTQLVYMSFYIGGLFIMVKNARKEMTAGHVGPYSAILVWVIVTFGVNGWGINLNWPRYYIPFMMSSVMVFGIGFSKALRLALKEKA